MLWIQRLTIIKNALKSNLTDTTIIISQRVSSIQDADMILILDDGKINEIGIHEELIVTNEIYKEIYESQQKGANING